MIRLGEGNGTPLQYSCLENPRDGGAWWAASMGVTQSQTRLKWLSSISNDTSDHISWTASWVTLASMGVNHQLLGRWGPQPDPWQHHAIYCVVIFLLPRSPWRAGPALHFSLWLRWPGMEGEGQISRLPPDRRGSTLRKRGGEGEALTQHRVGVTGPQGKKTKPDS